MKLPGRLLLIILLLSGSAPVFSQQQQVSKLVTQIDSFANRMPAEKVFIQTDKPYYNSNDTIWMKAYVLDAGLSYSKQSALLYVELINDTGKVVVRQAHPVKYGVSVGQMALDNKIVLEGSYTLRAYTNWIQNQGAESFFTKQLYITNAEAGSWLISGQNKLSKKEGKDNIEMALQFTDLNKNLVRLRELQVKIMNGDKTINRDNIQTDLSGKVNINFNLPDKVNAQKLTIVAQDMRKGEGNKTLLIPVTLNRPENIDLQFMPEGGALVAGLQSKIGFKAIGEDGRGYNVSGNIINSKGVICAAFKSVHNGMGVFQFTPQAGETYTAKISSNTEATKNYPLPAVQNSGINLHITNIANKDSLLITLHASADLIGTNNKYAIVGISSGKVCYAAMIAFSTGIVNARVAKDRFLSGITRFTLFNADRTPLAERIVFIDHNDGLNISINTSKPTYNTNDSVVLYVKVQDKNNQPITGSFSLAVTDNSQVKPDSINMTNIQDYMLLSADLKGNIEQPAYYFNNKNTDRYEVLDNLLLTQGWVGYNWKDVLNLAYINKFRAEPEIAVTGQLSRVGGKSLAGLPVSLLSTQPLLIRDTVSDKDGRFGFYNLPRIDTASFLLEVKDKKGKMFEAFIDADEFVPAKVTGLNAPGLKPWYVNIDSTALHNNLQALAYQKELDNLQYPDGKHRLKEVQIKALKTIKTSHNLNGPGIADQVLDEEDMKKAKKLTLAEMLETGVIKGAYYAGMAGINKVYKLYEKKLFIIIDGTPHEYNNYNILNDISAEDIRGIEVFYNLNSKYTVKYDPDITLHTPRAEWPAYLEITTWSGNGAFMHRVSGRYLYKPLPITWPKEFYKPKYSPKTNALTDLRSTILWEPNIITDKNGTATISFHAKTTTGQYTATIQGADLSGKVGYQQDKITIIKAN